jgi:hypothetical protein
MLQKEDLTDRVAWQIGFSGHEALDEVERLFDSVNRVVARVEHLRPQPDARKEIGVRVDLVLVMVKVKVRFR